MRKKFSLGLKVRKGGSRKGMFRCEGINGRHP